MDALSPDFKASLHSFRDSQIHFYDDGALDKAGIV